MNTTNDGYSPKSIDGIVFASERERGMIEDIASGATSFPFSGVNGILLYGVWGTGKTTLARLLPDAIEHGKGGQDSYYRFISCMQSQNGASLMASIQRQAELVAFTHSGYHYFVLDEVDMLTPAAMLSVKAVMNMPMTIFIMTTNDRASVEKGVANRCKRVPMNAAPPEAWLPFARRVLADRGVEGVDEGTLVDVIADCNGSVREIADSVDEIARRRLRKAA